MIFSGQHQRRRDAVLAALAGMTIREARDLLFEIAEALWEGIQDRVLGTEDALGLDHALRQVASELPGLSPVVSELPGVRVEPASFPAKPP